MQLHAVESEVHRSGVIVERYVQNYAVHLEERDQKLIEVISTVVCCCVCSVRTGSGCDGKARKTGGHIRTVEHTAQQVAHPRLDRL